MDAPEKESVHASCCNRMEEIAKSVIVRADDFQHLIENLFHLPHQCELGAGAVEVVIRASNMEIMVALQIVSQKTDAAFQRHEPCTPCKALFFCHAHGCPGSGFGRHIAQELNELGHQVMAIDSNEDRVNAVLSYVTNAQIGDSTSEYFLRSLGVGNFDVCIVTIGGNFQSSLETTSLLKELGAKLVVSRAERDVQAKFLLRNGADEVVYPEKQLAKWAAIRYSSEHILDYIELQDDHAIMEVTIPPEWMNRTIGEINIRKKYNINILALKKDGKLDMSITPDTQLSRDESMLVLGKYASIQKCFRL